MIQKESLEVADRFVEVFQLATGEKSFMFSLVILIVLYTDSV
jgi:hypothetical protein